MGVAATADTASVDTQAVCRVCVWAGAGVLWIRGDERRFRIYAVRTGCARGAHCAMHLHQAVMCGGQLFKNLDNSMVALVVGIVFTSIVQSSGASLGIYLSLAQEVHRILSRAHSSTTHHHSHIAHPALLTLLLVELLAPSALLVLSALLVGVVKSPRWYFAHSRRQCT